eukprot:SAG31_NODE_1732_length_7421_cov_10.241191_9_plen_79_part_00
MRLRHETVYEWQVRTWQTAERVGRRNSLYDLAADEPPGAGSPSEWSAPHRFETLVTISHTISYYLILSHTISYYLIGG